MTLEVSYPRCFARQSPYGVFKVRFETLFAVLALLMLTPSLGYAATCPTGSVLQGSQCVIFLPPPPNPPSETIPATSTCNAAINQVPLPPDFVPNPHIGAAFGCQRPSQECGDTLFAFIFGVATGNGDVLRRDVLGCLPPELICPDGFTLIPGTQICQRNLCPVRELNPLPTQAQDPDTFAFEFQNKTVDITRLNASMTAALTCLVKGSGQEYQSFVTSAWRPPAYQSHLLEVWQKWQKLKDNILPECQVLRSKVENELNKHGLQNLGVPPAGPNGPHPRGAALDVTRAFIPTVERLSALCHVFRPYKKNDPIHVIHQ